MKHNVDPTLVLINRDLVTNQSFDINLNKNDESLYNLDIK